ncbi:hypothetical protein AWH56_018375 [Anaerobacillus isosaccharinicus]|uniref:Uncharacterized protein n=1 Tax=Anaerobacillus isosaccharinicus TaxID=1532552 RepID=A0A1S2M5R5_9BACI|nr:hypothetical protein [Anaerobacillus isosaccharinicus]MBA5587129.1 hypothetical protein [Anaerobacillus isosaccharinicus]QOY34675.1 hypothetical protein AWH56_018375 [Anaerobacillus isosaccharinicus]
MRKKLVGNGISSFGLGLIVSSIVYPLGFMSSQSFFYGMLVIGAVLLLTGKFIGKMQNEIEVISTKIQ